VISAARRLVDVSEKIMAFRPIRVVKPPKRRPATAPRAAEFFAGIGLVRSALEQAGISVVFANDIEPAKARLYAANFDASDFVLDDVRTVRGGDIPDVEIATASFPCTDVSLAGNRLGLSGDQSGMLWEFARVIEEMGGRKPPLILLENVIGFATSHGGADLANAIQRMNALGYHCDIVVLDAAWFVAQSRPRMFIIGSRFPSSWQSDWSTTRLRPAWIGDFVSRHPDLDMHAMPLTAPAPKRQTLAGYVEKLPRTDARWWDPARLARFIQSLSPIHTTRLAELSGGSRVSWATAYRRTRNGTAVWEIRADAISGCLRTARGGSSKQAVVEAGRGTVRVRWMTAREYARLQGAPDFQLGTASENAAMFGLGDAVCVPAVAWIAQSYLAPLLRANTKPASGRA